MVQKSQTSSLGSLMAKGETARTTEAEVLTPTTVKLLGELLESEDLTKVTPALTVVNDGFVVPLPPPNKNNQKSFVKLDSSSWQGCTATVLTPTKSEQLTILDVPASIETMTMKTRSSSKVNKPMQPQILNTIGGRKHANVKRTPKKRPGVKAATNEFDLSPDEMERLKVRRERNKAAAARCRKRRMDQISTLSEEVEHHEEKKRILENTIAQLRAQKEELEFILAQHQDQCHLSVPQHLTSIAVKSEPVLIDAVEKEFLTTKIVPAVVMERTSLKPKRPLTLNIESANQAKVSQSAVEGVLIDTPSNILTSLGFDTLMTSTGLTPTTNIVTPVSFMTSASNSTNSCSSQQRSSEMVLDLNTPASENLSLVSL